MSGKRPRPMIGKLSELLISGKKTGFSDVITSPTSPLDLKTPSSRGSKRYDIGGVGLGIVAALDKSSTDSCKHAVCSSSLSRSNVIVLNSEESCGIYEGLEIGNEEDFTYVISHGGSGKSSTKVYYDGGERMMKSSTKATARFVEDVCYPTSDFLSCCESCRRKLQGKDIYMYRGEKAFCSSECRSTQIMMDERKEQCRSQVSTYDSGDIFFSTGILAT